MVFTSPAEPMLRLLSWLERCIVFPSTVRSAPLYPRVAAAGGAPSLPRNRRGISIRGKKRGQIPRSCRQSSRARRPRGRSQILRWNETELKLPAAQRDRKSTRLNSSHGYISYAVFCLKKKKDTSTGPHYSSE